jgi:acyl-ACP thioesterase
MARTGQIWVLSRLSVFLERRPVYGEAVTVRTWPRGWEKLFAVRDYDIQDPTGRPLVRGRSGWLILDMEKRRPLRVQQIVETLPRNEGINAFSAAASGLAAQEHLEKTGIRSAAYSDIDYNGHVNNTRYIQWIQDIIPREILEKAEQMRLDINYLSEVKPGEITELWIAPVSPAGGSGRDYPADPGYAAAAEGRRPDSGQPVFRAELRVRKDS